MHVGSPAEIEARVRGLTSLSGAGEALGGVVECGAAAIPYLREALLTGAPNSIPEPRGALVQALAALGAQAVLLEYLRYPRPIADPVCRLAEEAVENLAARSLRDSPEARATLESLIAARCLPGAIEILAAWQDEHVLPMLARCLEDDVCRRATTEALASFGVRSAPVLIASAQAAGDGSPSARRRRADSLALLARLPDTAAHWPELRALTADSDVGISCQACRVGLRGARSRDELEALAALALRRFAHVEWPAAVELQEALECRARELEAWALNRLRNEIAPDSEKAILRRLVDNAHGKKHPPAGESPCSKKDQRKKSSSI